MILIATQCFAPDVGGIETLVSGLAGALHRRGHRVMVCADRPRRDAATSPAFPYPLRRFAGPRPWRRRAKARYINRALRRGEIDYLICDSWKSLELLIIPPGVRSLCLAHGMEFPQTPAAAKQRRIQATLARVGTVVANSHYTAERARSCVDETTRLEVIHPGVDAPAAAGELVTRRIGQQLDGLEPRLVSVARLEQHKGQDTVLRCLPALLQEYPRLGYLCLGEGPARPELEQLIRERRLEDHVLLAGNSDAATRSACLQACDLFVLPGRAVADRIEGFGIAFIEAAWAGLPAVAGRSGGAGEAVVNGITGRICDGEDVESVRQAIRELLGDPALRRQMGSNARERARQFAWDETVRRYEALLGLAPPA